MSERAGCVRGVRRGWRAGLRAARLRGLAGQRARHLRGGQMIEDRGQKRTGNGGDMTED